MNDVESTEILEDPQIDQDSTQSVDQDADSSGSDAFGSGETIEVIDTPETQASTLTYNVAVLFVLSMLVGLVIFHILSRRWQT